MLYELYKQKQTELNQLENTIITEVEKQLTIDDRNETGNDFIMAKISGGCSDSGEPYYSIYIKGELTEESVCGLEVYIVLAKHMGI